MYSNLSQSKNTSVYGVAKARSAEIPTAQAESIGADFQDVILPNLFGEHGRPFYNAVTATICHMLARGEQPTVESDAHLTLLHAQDAADQLLGYGPVDGPAAAPAEYEIVDASRRAVSFIRSTAGTHHERNGIRRTT